MLDIKVKRVRIKHLVVYFSLFLTIHIMLGLKFDVIVLVTFLNDKE